MSDILSRLEAQGQGFSNIAERGQEMVQGFDNDRLMAQGQTLAYNMGKAQLSTLIGAERVAGLQHGVPVAYSAGKAIAQRLQGMPTTKAEAVARAQQAARAAAGRAQQAARAAAGQAQSTAEGAAGEVAQRVESTARPLVADIAETGLGDRAGAIPEGAAEEATAASRAALSESSSRLSSVPGTRQGAEEALERSRSLLSGDETSTLPKPRVDIPEPDFQNRLPELPKSDYTPGNLDYPKAPALKGNLPKPRTSGPPADIAQEESDRQLAGEIGQESEATAYFTGLRPVEQSFPAPPTAAPTAAPPPSLDAPTAAPRSAASLANRGDSQQDTPQNPLETQDDEEEDLQERLQSLRNVTGDPDDTGGSQPSSEPSLRDDVEPGGDDPVTPSTASRVARNITRAETTVAPEEEIADAVPGLGEILGGIIGIGALIAGAVEGDHGTSKPPQQPPGMPASQTAYDSAPVINSDDYHQI